MKLGDALFDTSVLIHSLAQTLAFSAPASYAAVCLCTSQTAGNALCELLVSDICKFRHGVLS